MFDETVEQGTIQQRATEVLSKMCSLTSSKLGPVSVIRGLVSCGNTDLLLAEIPLSTEESTVIFQQIFQFICILCQGDITLHYQAFQILLLWYTRLTKLPSRLERKTLMSQFTSILESTLNLVMLNWDSPVEDVPEAVVDTFSCMMSVWDTAEGIYLCSRALWLRVCPTNTPIWNPHSKIHIVRLLDVYHLIVRIPN